MLSGVLSSYRSGDSERAQHGSPACEDILDEVESEALQAEHQDTTDPAKVDFFLLSTIGTLTVFA